MPESYLGILNLDLGGEANARIVPSDNESRFERVSYGENRTLANHKTI
ncbi:hypothetical protein RKD52_001923 [Metabacillus sp. SLBN-84]